jgi:2,3-bisphosphoglycerate-dependent phosphoglycerate mutase
MNKQVKLIMVRHGQSLWNKENLFTGWADVPLTEQGKEEASEAGKLLEDYNFHSAFCSTLTRANDTLSIILNANRLASPDVIFDWRLNERHYGALEGLNKKQVSNEYGVEQVKIWRRSFDIPPPPLIKSDERYLSHQKKYSYLSADELPLSESLKNTLDRVGPYWLSTIMPILKNGSNVLVVAHGNSLRALAKIIVNISNEKILDLNIPTGVPREYTFNLDLSLLHADYLGNAQDIIDKANAVAHQANEQQKK